MNRTVLIADPSAIMRRILERALRLAGLEPQHLFEASDGDEALALARQHQPDLILCDSSLPGQDGMAVLRALKESEETRDLEFVFVSCQANESRVLEALSLGARGYLRKPFTVEQVRDTVAPVFA